MKAQRDFNQALQREIEMISRGVDEVFSKVLLILTQGGKLLLRHEEPVHRYAGAHGTVQPNGINIRSLADSVPNIPMDGRGKETSSPDQIRPFLNRPALLLAGVLPCLLRKTSVMKLFHCWRGNSGKGQAQ